MILSVHVILYPNSYKPFRGQSSFLRTISSIVEFLDFSDAFFIF